MIMYWFIHKHTQNVNKKLLKYFLDTRNNF
jgi:hypothetical protein